MLCWLYFYSEISMLCHVEDLKIMHLCKVLNRLMPTLLQTKLFLVHPAE